MSGGMHPTHVIARLQEARERVAHGWPSMAVALAGHPLSTAQARLVEATDAVFAADPAHPWVQVLTDVVLLADEAREVWGSAPAHMPPMTSDLAPCGRDLRMHLPDARRCMEWGLAWEDPGGLTRGQALCVLHLAVCMAEWRAEEERYEWRMRKAREEIERERAASTAVAVRAIWGGQPKAEPTKDPRSLRDLARVAGLDHPEES